ncbi:MAG: ATP-dependent helicase [Bacteroidota bacterium]
MFVWTEDELNEKQTAVVKNEANILLVACPGSGKTRTLTYKVAYELSKLDDARKFVIAITYTNIAAEEIKERVQLLGVDTTQLWIGTIHAFCNEWILKPYFSLLEDLKFGFRIISAHESEELLVSFCEPYKKQRVTSWDCGHYATINGIQTEITAGSKKQYVDRVLEDYFAYLRDNHAVNYEQILSYSYELLVKHPIISETLSNLFIHILVDEYQDTKDIQYHIIGKIYKAGKGKTIGFIVGDPNQCIYSNLGGYPISLENLNAISGISFELHHLENNYRSSRNIVEYFDVFKTYANTIIPSSNNIDYESIITHDEATNVADLVTEIVRLLQYNIDVRSVHPNEICIVAPQWVHLAPITRSLIIAMPDYSFNGPGMAPFSRDLDNFWYKLSRIVLTEPSPDMFVRRLRWANEVIDDLESSGFNTSALNSKQILKICNAIELDEIDGLMYLEQFFVKFLEAVGVELDVYQTLKSSFDSFFESSRKRIDRIKSEGNDSIENIESFKKVFKQREGITISSIHGVKGAEYDTVIAFGILQGYVPHWFDDGGDISAKRLLYVLSSRARKNLHIISERGRTTRGGSQYATTQVLRARTYSYGSVNFNG